MGDADGGTGLVDVLSAGAAGAVGIHPDIVRIDLHMDVVGKLRHHVAGNKGGLPLARRVEGRDADQTVHAVFAAEPAVGILTVDLDGHGLDARHIAVQVVKNLDGIALALCPAGVHAVQHGAPVTGLRAAGARVQAEDGVVGVIFSGEQRLGLQLLQLMNKLIQHLPDLRDHSFVLFFVPQLDHVADVREAALQLLEPLHGILQAPVLPDDLCGFLRIVPESRLFHHAVQLGDPLLLVVKVQGVPDLLERFLVGGEGIFHVI